MTDENGTVHTLVRALGKGGQGQVWLTASKRRVVKLLSKRMPAEILRRQIAFVMRADLSGLHVARPLALLREPHVGYVAEFLADMVPIRALMAPPRGQSVLRWYSETGGLRRRLRLLAHAGEALDGLHTRGLVYGDISHNNVFVSEPIGSEEAWLIDLDNLHNDSDPKRAFYTPDYGAPEVVSGLYGLTTFSDAWAFGVLAFNVLALTHPFYGDLVEEGEPELLEDARAGRLPWIEDSGDDRNRASNGLPRELVLSNQLRQTAASTFEAGRLDKTGRPSLSKWVERLHTAADRMLRCTECTSTFYDTLEKCPWCNAPRSQVVTVAFYRWEPGRGLVKEMKKVAQVPLATETVILPRRTSHAETGLGARRVTATLEPTERGITLRAGPGAHCWITDPTDVRGTRPREVTERGVKLPLDALQRSYLIHFEPVDVPHRVARIEGVR